MKQADRKSPTFRQLTRGAYFYQAPLPVGGFKWRDDLVLASSPESISGLSNEGFTGPWLVGPFRDGLVQPEVNPLQPAKKGDPGLHRQFAALWAEESILAFANQCGHLLPKTEMAPLRPPKVGSLEHGESLGQWQAEIVTCRRLLYFWDLVQSDDKRELGRYVKWAARDSVSVVWSTLEDGYPQPATARDLSDPEPLVRPGTRVDLLELWDFGAVVDPMRLHVHAEVNKKLRGVSPHVLPYVREPHRITLIPDSLRAAIYLLFALELAGETETRLCGNPKCPKPNGLFTPQTARQEFCGDRCRKQAWDLKHPKSARGKGAHDGEA